MTGRDEAWENWQTGRSTEILSEGDSGDFNIYQSDVEDRRAPLKGRLVSKYPYRPTGLLHLMFFLLQTGIPVPNRDDWNERFYGGEYEESTEHLVDLPKIIRQAEIGRPVILRTDDEKQVSEGLTQIPQSYNNDKISVILCPAITKEGNFVYVNHDAKDEEPAILWDPKEVSTAFDAIRRQMLSGVRGQGPLVGKIYSEFPFEAYDNARDTSTR